MKTKKIKKDKRATRKYSHQMKDHRKDPLQMLSNIQKDMIKKVFIQQVSFNMIPGYFRDVERVMDPDRDLIKWFNSFIEILDQYIFLKIAKGQILKELSEDK